MEGSEELRETLVAMRRENDILRTETTHANLLLKALDAVLCVEGDDDPFVGVFEALLPVFDCATAVVLIERERSPSELECAASNYEDLVGSLWTSGRTFEKALDGRVVTSVAASGLVDWPACAESVLDGTQPALFMPLGVRDRRGLLMLLRQGGQTGFDRSHVALAKKFSLLASHAFAAKRASQTAAESHRLKILTEQLKASQDTLQYRANHDSLTGLPNRTYVQELTDRMIAEGEPGQQLALAFIDLDDFKSVNDLHGHAVGDGLLRSVAERVSRQVRPTDVVGRISGDEFVVIFNPFAQRAEISSLANRIKTCLQEPVSVEGVVLTRSGSVGVALYPAHGRDYDTLKRHADTARYQAKLSAKGSVAFFSKTLGRQANEKLALERRLHQAVAAREFKCAVQQKVNIRTGQVVGFEALARWVDGRGVVRTPDKFLRVVDELGLLNEMTLMIAKELIESVDMLSARFGEGLKFNINITPKQCSEVGFMIEVIDLLRRSGRPQDFILEITEESLASFGPFECHVLPLIRRYGLNLSVDDFGTGYSSLAKLADLTVDELKVDRSLISSIGHRSRNQSILRAIESLSLALGISVVAEGVETEAECEYLLSHTNITTVQGYLYHRPHLLSDMLRRRGDEASAAAPRQIKVASGL